MTGRRIVWPAARQAELEPYEVGSPGPGEVLVETEVSLISPGTERAHLAAAENTPNAFPAYPGYSNVGRVLACGDGVTRLVTGDRVSSYSPHWSHCLVDERMAAKVPEGLAPETAAFCSLANVALQGVRKAGVEIGAGVAVLGLGVVGLLALAWARVAGAGDVVGIDPTLERHAAALSIGATATAPSADEWPVATSPAVVIDATGVGHAIVDALELCAPRGAVVVLGSPRGRAEHVDFYRTVHLKGLRVIGAHDYVRPARESSPGLWSWADDAAVALRFLAERRITTDPIAPERRDPADAARVYQDLLDGHAPATLVFDWQTAGSA